MTPEDEQRAADEAHRQRLYQLEMDKHELEKQKAKKTFQASLISVFATIFVGLIAAAATMIAAWISLGKKVDPAEPSILNNIFEGAKTSYKIFHPGTPLAQALPNQTAPAAPVIPNRTTTNPISTSPVVDPPLPATTATVPEGRPCEGLSLQHWSPGPAQVQALFQDNRFIGYEATVPLKNVGDGAMLVLRTTGTLTADNGMAANIWDSSINVQTSAHINPAMVDPNVVLPASFRFRGQGSPGKQVRFNVNLWISTDGGKTWAMSTLGCGPVAVASGQTP